MPNRECEVYAWQVWKFGQSSQYERSFFRLIADETIPVEHLWSEFPTKYATRRVVQIFRDLRVIERADPVHRKYGKSWFLCVSQGIRISYGLPQCLAFYAEIEWRIREPERDSEIISTSYAALYNTMVGGRPSNVF